MTFPYATSREDGLEKDTVRTYLCFTRFKTLVFRNKTVGESVHFILEYFRFSLFKKLRKIINEEYFFMWYEAKYIITNACLINKTSYQN